MRLFELTVTLLLFTGLASAQDPTPFEWVERVNPSLQLLDDLIKEAHETIPQTLPSLVLSEIRSFVSWSPFFDWTDPFKADRKAREHVASKSEFIEDCVQEDFPEVSRDEALRLIDEILSEVLAPIVPETRPAPPPNNCSVEIQPQGDHFEVYRGVIEPRKNSLRLKAEANEPPGTYAWEIVPDQGLDTGSFRFVRTNKYPQNLRRLLAEGSGELKVRVLFTSADGQRQCDDSRLVYFHFDDEDSEDET